MKRIKREENSIVIYFLFYAVLFILLLVYIVLSIYPKIMMIEDKKQGIKSTYDSIEVLTSQGLNFTEFQGVAKKMGLNSYTKELLKNIEESFYNLHFINKSNKTFLDFLETKRVEFNNPLSQQRFSKKEDQIIQLLPIYSEVAIDDSDNILSNFKFTNYIEVILETFSLDYSNEIGLKDIVLVEEYSNNESKSQLNTNIYYIPVVLSVEGAKYNMINFLYFLEKVGGIYITGEGKIKLLEQNEDGFLFRGGVKTILKNKNYKTASKELIDAYNIYENQLIDIESITIPGYLDKNTKISKSENDEGMYQRVKNTQGDDKITVELILRFYVKGVQNIKMIEAIEGYITYFEATKKILAKEFKNKGLQINVKESIKRSQSVVTELTKELKPINISINTQERLVETLLQTSNLTDILHKIHGQIGYNFYISHFLKEYSALLKNKNLAKTNFDLYSYLIRIEKNLEELEQGKTETIGSYNIRINSKKYFQKVLQYQRQINIKN